MTTGDSKEGKLASSTLINVYCTVYCIVGLSYRLVAYYVRPLLEERRSYEVIIEVKAQTAPFILHN